MTKGNLIQVFSDARDSILDGIRKYVKKHRGKVELDGVSYTRVSESDCFYLSRYRYLSLETCDDGRTVLTYDYNPAQEDDPSSPAGGWEIYEEDISMFSCDELYNIICNIKE